VGNLSENQLFIVVIVVAVLVAAAFGVLTFLDYRKIQDTNDQIQKIQGQITNYRAMERKIDRLQRDLDFAKPKHAENQKALPAYPFLEALLNGIQAQASAASVVITTYSVQEADGGRGRGAKDAGPWKTISISMDVEGYFFDLLKFINLLEHYPRFLACTNGSFSMKSRGGRSQETPSEEERLKGPKLKLSLDLNAFQAKTVAPKPQPKRQAQGKAPQAKSKAPARKPAPKPAPAQPTGPDPEGKVYDVHIPPDEEIEVPDTRLNPFVIRLERVAPETGPGGASDGQPGEVTPPGYDEQKALVEGWETRLNQITYWQATHADPKRTYFAWKKLVEEVTKKKNVNHFPERRETVLRKLLAPGFKRTIVSEYEAYLEKAVRTIRMRMEAARHVGMPNEVFKSFEKMRNEILEGDHLPPRVRKEFQTGMDIFLDTIRGLVEKEGQYEPVLDETSKVKESFSEEWAQKPFIKEFLERTEAYRQKAQALVEFFEMKILVSGLVWLPDDAKVKRVAIVNDTAVVEGKEVPAEKIENQPRVRKTGEKDKRHPVTLKRVGRDRFVWFGYRGLEIKYPLGNREKGK